MITPSDSLAFSYVKATTDVDAMLKKGNLYQIVAWHKDKVCVLADGHKHWTRSSYFEPVKN